MAHHVYAGVAELADAPDLGSGAARRGGSSPFTRTNEKRKRLFRNGRHKLNRRNSDFTAQPGQLMAEFLSVAAGTCGSSSVVEHHLAKVGVAGSNPVFRSNERIKQPLPGWRNWQTHRT